MNDVDLEVELLELRGRIVALEEELSLHSLVVAELARITDMVADIRRMLGDEAGQ